MEVRLLSNGKFSYFPLNVYMDIFKVEHIIKLSLANIKNYEDIVTECLDSVIDFDRTGVIKSSSELCVVDRNYLMLLQRFNADEGNLKLNVKCNVCETKNTVELSSKDIKEKFLLNVKECDKFSMVVPSLYRVNSISKEIDILKEDDKYNYIFDIDEDGNKILNGEYVRYLMLLYYITDFDNLFICDRFDAIKNLSAKDLYIIVDWIKSNNFGLEYSCKCKCSGCKKVFMFNYEFNDARDFF